MFKKLCILLLAVVLVVPAMAQQGSGYRDDTSFAPKAGQWQISAMIGNNTMFDQDLTYVLPTYWKGSGNDFSFGSDLGLGSESDGLLGNVLGNALPDSNTHGSDSPGKFLSLGNINSNSLVNLIGLQAKYFVMDRWDLNLMFSMNISATPSKNYIEGEYENEFKYLPIQAHEYIEGELQNLWSAALGSNYYFNVKNERISLYLGAVAGWQMGRIKTVLPYTGYIFTDTDLAAGASSPEDADMPLEVYVPSSRAGQVWAIRGGVVAGVEYSVAEGLVLGFEVQPASYTYTRFQIVPSGQMAYEADHHNVGIFSTPNFKIGFRF